MFKKHLTVDYHQQDKGTQQEGYYCGPASAQMVLNSIQAGLLSQDELYADCHTRSRLDRNVNWATAPDSLKRTMNKRKPASFAKTFNLIATANEDSISRKIVWTIFKDNVAPIALVEGWAHWIVIRGFASDSAPSSASDKSYKIRAFWIYDPWPPASQEHPNSPAPPHKDGDLCGSDGKIYGTTHGHISYQKWQTDYMTGVPSGPSVWAGKFIAVCDPDSESGNSEDEKGDGNENERKEENQKREKEHNQYNESMRINEAWKKVIGEQKAGECAIKAMKDYELIDEPFLKEILMDVVPVKPTLVRHLENKNDFYYIVPLVGKDKNVHSLVIVDGKDGSYGQASFAKDLKNPIDFVLLSKEKVKALIEKQLDVKKEKIIVNDRYLVWMPCIESFSPHFPFHEVTIGKYKVYVRIDGKIFTNLTTGIPGA